MARRVVTLLFTDIEQSTRSWLEDETAMADALARHDAILRRTVEHSDGTVLKHTGDGMLAVFTDPRSAADAAVRAQRALRADPDGGGRLRSRMAIHTGPCTERDGDVFGPTVNRTARLMAAAHGGQVLASSVVAATLADDFPLADLGVHRLRDLLEPEAILQVVVVDAGAYPPLVSLDSFDHNLPPQRTRLIGRDGDVSTLRELLRTSRLVTLTGIGGVGKTRLALEVAVQELDLHPGTLFVDLAPVAAGEDVVQAMAAAAGLPSGDAAGTTDALVRLLANRSMLVVLDNCEHVLDASADLVERLLDASPTTVVLATSREPLGLAAERVWRVPSIADPAAAVELFRDRATASGADLGTGTDVDALIVDLCDRLDGIPLAIELAASRTSHLALTDLASRLEERFQLLTGERRAQPRHQTLRATLDWSYDLLADGERRLLREASVFIGGCTLAALEHVAKADDVGVIDRLASLVDRSLIVPVANADGPGRYKLLETVRLYALDRLADAGEVADVRRRHLDWVRSLLAGSMLSWPSAGPLATATAERDNVLAALDWVESTGDLRQLGELAGAALGLVGLTSWVDDGWRFFGRADVEAELSGDDLAQYLAAGAATANSLGDFPRQLELAERGRAVATVGSSAWRVTTSVLANVTSVFDPPRSFELYEELLAATPDGNGDELGYTLARSADPALMTLDLATGARRLDEAEATTGFADLDLGFPHLLLGEVERVRSAISSLNARYPELSGWIAYRGPLLAGLLAATEGRLEEAAQHLVEAARRTERVPVQLVEHDVVNGFAVLAFHRGDHRRAAELLATASTGPVWGRSPGMFAVHVHYRDLVRAHVPSDEVRAIRAAAQRTSVTEVLTAEVQQHL